MVTTTLLARMGCIKKSHESSNTILVNTFIKFQRNSTLKFTKAAENALH
jgi:hypothetical protein